MTIYRPPDRPAVVEITSIEGSPTKEERAAIQAALELYVARERRTRAPSMWLRAGRAQGRRLGMYDYRDRITPGQAWALSLRFPSGGREFQGRAGRGDSR